MAAAFRSSLQFSLLTGASFLDHPGGEGVPGPYRSRSSTDDHPATSGVPDFDIASEQYYMHLDPDVHVLARLDFQRRALAVGSRGRRCRRSIRASRGARASVFYASPGHLPAELQIPPPSAWYARAWHGQRANDLRR